jgi:hypothetical protein
MLSTRLFDRFFHLLCGICSTNSDSFVFCTRKGPVLPAIVEEAQDEERELESNDVTEQQITEEDVALSPQSKSVPITLAPTSINAPTNIETNGDDHDAKPIVTPLPHKGVTEALVATKESECSSPMEATPLKPFPALTCKFDLMKRSLEQKFKSFEELLLEVEKRGLALRQDGAATSLDDRDTLYHSFQEALTVLHAEGASLKEFLRHLPPPLKYQANVTFVFALPDRPSSSAAAEPRHPTDYGAPLWQGLAKLGQRSREFMMDPCNSTGQTSQAPTAEQFRDTCLQSVKRKLNQNDGFKTNYATSDSNGQQETSSQQENVVTTTDAMTIKKEIVPEKVASLNTHQTIRLARNTPNPNIPTKKRRKVIIVDSDLDDDEEETA